MDKNKIWLVVALLSLASCQSTRFMQDDMYFSEIDAIREVREFENAKTLARLNKNQIDVADPDESEKLSSNEDYYDYSYTSRLRRFNKNDNTWSYYDPYYTNYYWYNNSNTSYFGNSLYTTYTWWGPNFSNNYNSRYWNDNKYNISIGKMPYNRYVFNGWNTDKGYTNRYYNSFDNNCYSRYNRFNHQFSALMQKNGITRNVFQRPEINYTAIRESKVTTPTIADTSLTIDITHMQSSNSNRDTDNNSSNKSLTSNKTTTNTTNSNNSTTTKRWDNHNGDLNISPNSGKSADNTSRTSRSGVYSEGSRNNNYVYKGSAIQNKGSNNNGGTQNKGKDPK